MDAVSRDGRYFLSRRLCHRYLLWQESKNPNDSDQAIIMVTVNIQPGSFEGSPLIDHVGEYNKS